MNPGPDIPVPARGLRSTGATRADASEFRKSFLRIHPLADTRPAVPEEDTRCKTTPALVRHLLVSPEVLHDTEQASTVTAVAQAWAMLAVAYAIDRLASAIEALRGK